MNDQEAADLFSAQVDRLLQRETPVRIPGGGTGQELLALAQQLAQVQFQASPVAQAAFQNQLASWFGSPGPSPTSGPKFRRWNMVSGKMLAVVISILVTVVTAVATLVISIMVMVSGVIPGSRHATTTPSTPTTPAITSTISPTLSMTATLVPTGTITPPATPPSTVDSIQPITVGVTIVIRIDDLVPGLPPAGDDEHDGGGKRNGDHDRGHGNDPDHYDEDNPGHKD